MRILYLCKTINSRHGGRTHAREFFAAIGKRGDVEVIDSYYPLEENGDSEGKAVGGREKLQWLPRWLFAFLCLTLVHRKRTKHLSSLIADNRYNVLLVRHETTRIDFSYIKRRHPNTKIAIELNAILSDEHFSINALKVFTRWFEYKQFRQVDKIFPVSSALQRSLLSAGISESRILVNPNGVDTARFNPGLLAQRAHFRDYYNIPKDKFVIGYVGGMEAFRRLPDLVKSYSLLANGKMKNRVFLFMVGDGKDYREVELELGKQCPSDSYRQLGWQHHADIPAVMATFDMAVMPYTLEYCSPLKLFEYLAMGLPTIGPDTKSVRELFVDGEHLWLNEQNTRDPDPLFELMQTLIDNPCQREQVAAKGFRLVAENYTWDANAARIVAALR